MSLQSILMITDPITQAWVAGFFSAVMSVFPVAMILLLPHDGWGQYLPSNRYTKMEREIHRLKQKLFEAEMEAKIAQDLLKGV
jgi:hypothetical protein